MKTLHHLELRHTLQNDFDILSIEKCWTFVVTISRSILLVRWLEHLSRAICKDHIQLVTH